MESKCHVGKECRYPSPGGFDVRNHALTVVLDLVDKQPVPECISTEDCIDCDNWEYVEEDFLVSEELK